MEELKQFFNICNFECAGIDGLIYKLHLRAQSPGLVHNKILGLTVLIKSRQEKTMFSRLIEPAKEDAQFLSNEVKRVGFLIDR
jgi:hypothetical protein